MKYRYQQARILRNEGDEDYGWEFIFPAGTSLNQAIEQLLADGVDYYEPRDIFDQLVITIED